VHPGGPRVVGHAVAIRATFEAIFANGSIRAWPEQVRRIEALTSSRAQRAGARRGADRDRPTRAYVLATNVYHKTAQGWRMVVHHASPGSQSARRSATCRRCCIDGHVGLVRQQPWRA
jgi:ketosteroid isomerase-like protein